MGCFAMSKEVPNKRYTPEFKKLVVETMRKEKLSYKETEPRFDPLPNRGAERTPSVHGRRR